MKDVNTARPQHPQRAWLAVLVGCFLIGVTSPSLHAQGGADEREYCFCTTPRPGQLALGQNSSGAPSTSRVKWRGMWHEYSPAPGDSPEDIMNALRNMVITQVVVDGTGDVVGPVVVDPATGRALFCVRGPTPRSGDTSARNDDKNMQKTTFQRIAHADAWFLRRAGGAFLGAPQGGEIRVTIKGLLDGLERVIEVVVPTLLGMQDVNGAVVNKMKDAGVNAIEADVDDVIDEQGMGFVIPGTGAGFDVIQELTVDTDDPGLSDILVFGTELALQINEVDADQIGTDAAEFLELAGLPALDMSGHWLVFYNGNGDQEYFVIDLAAQLVPADGLFVIGVPGVPNLDFTPAGLPATNAIQNGADAIALWFDPSGLLTLTDFQNTGVDTPPTGAQLVDALVYGTSDPDDIELLDALTPGQPQADENGRFLAVFESLQRRPQFGAPFASGAYVVAAPSPGLRNTWSDEGCALPGAGGFPELLTAGDLSAQSANLVALSDAAPSAFTGFFIALTDTPTPFKGGTLKPVPWIKLLFVTTNGAGQLNIPFLMPAGVPAGTELWLQAAIQDAGAVSGVALSNAVQGITP